MTVIFYNEGLVSKVIHDDLKMRCVDYMCNIVYSLMS